MSSYHRSQKGSSEPPPSVHRGQKSAYDNQRASYDSQRASYDSQRASYDSHPNQPQYSSHPHGNQVSPYSQAPVVTQPGVTNNTIIVGSSGQQQQKEPRDWSSKICDCCADMGICCCVLFCACPHASKLSSDMGESTCVPCCVPGWLISLRAQMRAKENIQGSLMDDCCTVAFCGPCAQCQLAREVRYIKMVRS